MDNDRVSIDGDQATARHATLAAFTRRLGRVPLSRATGDVVRRWRARRAPVEHDQPALMPRHSVSCDSNGKALPPQERQGRCGRLRTALRRSCLRIASSHLAWLQTHARLMLGTVVGVLLLSSLIVVLSGNAHLGHPSYTPASSVIGQRNARFKAIKARRAALMHLPRGIRFCGRSCG